tara:strand:- start:1016 stop:1885 length:870 start_codon:yes stop_codon:yes gene_type:complete
MAKTRHHFVPQGYLRGFAAKDDDSDSMIWVYRKNKHSVSKKQSTKSVAFRDKFYAQENQDGEEDTDTLEDAFAREIDSKLPAIVKLLEEKYVPRKRVLLDEDTLGELAFIIGLSFTRVPAFRDSVRQLYQQVLDHTFELVKMNEPEMKEACEKYGIKAETKEWASLVHMFEAAQQIAMTLLEKQWFIQGSIKGTRFITSDNPVVFKGVAPANPSSEVLFNLSKRISLVCSPTRDRKDPMCVELKAAEVRAHNGLVAWAAKDMVFSSFKSDALDRLVKKHIGSAQEVRVG